MIWTAEQRVQYRNSKLWSTHKNGAHFHIRNIFHNFFHYVKDCLEKVQNNGIIYKSGFSILDSYVVVLSAIIRAKHTICFGDKVESAKEIWERALGELQIQVSKANYTTWLSNSQGTSYQDNIFVVSVPNIFVAEWLSKRLYSLVRNTLANIIGKDIKVQFVIRNQDQLQASRLAYANQTDGGTSSKVKLDKFNPRYTFDSFVVGDCNRLAYAAAVEVAENPGHTYNPLFIHSTTGQGKTHLLHAIGHIATSNGFPVTYTSAEQFTSEFILAVRQKEVEDFRSKFRNIHILLFDDIQFLADKKQTQQFFFHIFNELYSNNHQIVIASDRSPKDMAMLSNKLRSRLEWGLVAPIQPPDFEARLSILQAKAEVMLTPPGLEKALQIIAEKIPGNVREVEGALAYLTAQAKLSGGEITPQIVNKLLTGTTNNKDTRLIIQIVADYFGLPVEELTSKKRDRKVALARQIAMYLMREENNYSFAQIGKDLGNRNHATALHSYEKIASEININHKLHDQILEIKETISSSRRIH
jgi:chromosomal replication initiator protein